MKISKITEDKKAHLDLLLLADEQESMIDLYLERGDVFALEEGDGAIRAICVVTRESEGTYELKNLAVRPEFQRQGYGRKLIEFLLSQYSDCQTLFVGTGESSTTLGFYRSLGFTESHRIERFFIDHYDHPMFADGVQLVDMIYLKKVCAHPKDDAGP